MSSFEAETLRLIDAIPSNANLNELEIHGGCPLAFDASGTRQREFERVALHEKTAEALHTDNSTYVSFDRRDAGMIGNSPDRLGEYAACLLMRARGMCNAYDPEQNRDRAFSEMKGRWFEGL